LHHDAIALGIDLLCVMPAAASTIHHFDSDHMLLIRYKTSFHGLPLFSVHMSTADFTLSLTIKVKHFVQETIEEHIMSGKYWCNLNVFWYANVEDDM